TLGVVAHLARRRNDVRFVDVVDTSRFLDGSATMSEPRHEHQFPVSCRIPSLEWGEPAVVLEPTVSLSLKTFLPVPVRGQPGDITSPCTSILGALRRHGIDASLIVPRAHPTVRLPFLRAGVPRLLAYVPYRFVRARAMPRAMQLFLNGVSKGDVAYLWSEMP